MEELPKRPLMNMNSLYDSLTSLKREVYSYLDQALTLDKQFSESQDKSKKLDVIIMYQKSLEFVEKALNFYNANKEQLSKMPDAIDLVDKLNKIKVQTVDRLNVLNAMLSSLGKEEDIEFLDISDDILSVDDDDDVILIESSESAPVTNKDDCKIIENPRKPVNLVDSKEATEIFRCQNAIRLFYIASDGTVSSPSKPTTISIFTFDE